MRSHQPSGYSEQRWEWAVDFTLECEQEVDGRWLAEVPELPGVLAYGDSSADAMAKAEVLALRVMADQLEHGESKPVNIRLSLPLTA
jgi:predicted RNase H-like HicB family nuclease